MFKGSMIFMTHPSVSLFRSTGSTALFTSLFLLLFFPTWGQSRPTDAELASEITRQLVCYPLERVNIDNPEGAGTSVEMCLAAVYEATAPRPLWVTVDGPTAKADIILSFLRDSLKHGLNPADYQVDKLLELWHSDKADELAQLDTILSCNLVKYIHDINFGQLKPHESDPDLFAEASEKTIDPSLSIKQVLAAPDLKRFLEGLPPQHHHYRDLQKALERYRQLAATGGWPELADGESLRPGTTDSRVPTVRKRLLITQELQGKGSSSNQKLYDTTLKKAVMLFQNRHGLTPDGVIGKKTRAAMNVTAEQKVDIIRINMARWRWHAHYLGSKYILVNIASFNLKAYQGNSDTPDLDFPVIVGEEENQTPVFSDSIAYLDFNPYWNITPSIAENEELTALRKDANYLVSRHVRLFSNWQPDAVELDSTKIDWHAVTKGRMRGFKLRQDPGPWNALGKIKFVFPNQYSVYMHDTPSQNLFSRTQRSFSHGCIRLGDPLALAIFVLEGQKGGWNKDKVMNLYNQNVRKTIQLSAPIPVHITYQTTWVDKDGTINFNSDIYVRDEKLLSILIK